MAPQRALVGSLLRTAARSTPAARASIRTASTCCSRGANLSTRAWRATTVSGRTYPPAASASLSGKLHYSTEKSGAAESRKWEFPDITRQLEVNQELEKTGKETTSAGEHKVIFVGTHILHLPSPPLLLCCFVAVNKTSHIWANPIFSPPLLAKTSANPESYTRRARSPAPSTSPSPAPRRASTSQTRISRISTASSDRPRMRTSCSTARRASAPEVPRGWRSMLGGRISETMRVAGMTGRRGMGRLRM
jgi:hypothetical protein